jgi:DMSO/TMAO reductase YedYZ molybdopterin-dependent catalytic subunit
MKEEKGIARRIFLKMTGGLLFMTAIPSSLYAYFVKQLAERTVERDKFKFDAKTGGIEWHGGKKEEYRLHIDGLVNKTRIFSYQDLQSLPQIEQVSDFHCVEGWSVPDIRWRGFRFREILRLVEAQPEATHVIFHSLGKTSSAPKGQDHYLESFPLNELVDPARELLLVLNMNHAPLPEEHGAPLRLIAPYDLGYKSIKFITRIELAKDVRPGWWTLANPIYSIEARVPNSRLRTKDSRR